MLRQGKIGELLLWTRSIGGEAMVPMVPSHTSWNGHRQLLADAHS